MDSSSISLLNDLCSLGNDYSKVNSKIDELVNSCVNIGELHTFKEHLFKVENDMELSPLMRSIEKEGVIV